MKKWTVKELKENGYEIENAKITSVDLSMTDYDCLCLRMVLEGRCWGTTYGGYSLGHGSLDCKDDFFDGSAKGMESIIRIMAVVGCYRFNDMKGKIIRVAVKSQSDPIKIIGNVIEDKWFDAETFYKEEE